MNRKILAFVLCLIGASPAENLPSVLSNAIEMKPLESFKVVSALQGDVITHFSMQEKLESPLKRKLFLSSPMGSNAVQDLARVASNYLASTLYVERELTEKYYDLKDGGFWQVWSGALDAPYTTAGLFAPFLPLKQKYRLRNDPYRLLMKVPETNGVALENGIKKGTAAVFFLFTPVGLTNLPADLHRPFVDGDTNDFIALTRLRVICGDKSSGAIYFDQTFSQP